MISSTPTRSCVFALNVLLLFACIAMAEDDPRHFPGRCSHPLDRVPWDTGAPNLRVKRLEGIVGQNPIISLDKIDDREGLPPSYACKTILVQIINDSNSLVRVEERFIISVKLSQPTGRHAHDNYRIYSDTLLWVESSTNGLVDNMENPFGVRPILITGTKQYNTGSGPRTIPLARVMTDDEIEEMKEDAKEREMRERAEQKAIGKAEQEALEAKKKKLAEAKRRTWRTADGTHSVEARFVTLIGQTVSLERIDGKQVSVPFALLSDECKDFIRERRWLQDSRPEEQ